MSLISQLWVWGGIYSYPVLTFGLASIVIAATLVTRGLNARLERLFLACCALTFAFGFLGTAAGILEAGAAVIAAPSEAARLSGTGVGIAFATTFLAASQVVVALLTYIAAVFRRRDDVRVHVAEDSLRKAA